MNPIEDKMLSYKKRIGTLNGQPVVEALTTGGLYLIVTKKSDGIVTIGTGPHRAVARFIARKREPSLAITELSKSEYVEQAAIDAMLPKYEYVTDRVNSEFQRQQNDR